MKCDKCGYENNEKAKFCTKCGSSLVARELPVPSKSSDNSKIIVIALIAVIVVLAGTIGYLVINGNSDDVKGSDDSKVSGDDLKDESVGEDDKTTARTDSSQQTSASSDSGKSKSWELIGSYTGSGSGSETIKVPDGEIMVELSAYPIKNYATNHLYVSGSNGASGGVDWGSTSAVETRSDSFTYASSTSETFTIDYYETVSWQVDFYRYQ